MENSGSATPSELPSASEPDSDHFLTTTGIVWGMIIGFISILAALACILWALSQFRILYAEIALTLVVVASVMVLILALATSAIIFRRLGLANDRHAMGLPEGSIRAIIALLLILVFSVTAVFLITNTQRAEERVFEKLSQERADAFSEGEEVLSYTELPVNEFGEDEAGNPFIRLVLKAESPPSTDMSQQLLTTLGTLVVAVASFYFGSQVVLTATSTEPGPTEPETPGPTGSPPSSSAAVAATQAVLPRFSRGKSAGVRKSTPTKS